MAFQKKTWKDRLVEFAGRRKLTTVSSSGNDTVVDVVRNEGAVSQEGDAFSASNMNDLEQRIYEEFDNLNSNLDGKANSADLGTAAKRSATSSVTENSTELLTSGGAYTALNKKLTTTALAGKFTIVSTTMSSATVSATSSKSFSKTISKDGYKCLGIVACSTGKDAIVLSNFYYGSDGKAYVTVFNCSSASQSSVAPIVYTLWVKES